MGGDPFFHTKPRDVLLFLREKEVANISEIAARTRSTYAHCFNLIKELEELGVVETSRSGRSRVVRLTETGRDLADLTLEFLEVLRSGRRRAGGKRILPEPQDRVAAYYRKVCEIEEKLSRGAIRDRAKVKRLLGRYRYLAGRTRPRDMESRRLRKETLSKIDIILKNLA